MPLSPHDASDLNNSDRSVKADANVKCASYVTDQDTVTNPQHKKMAMVAPSAMLAQMQALPKNEGWLKNISPNINSSSTGSTSYEFNGSRTLRLFDGANIQQNIQPHLYEMHQEREMQAARLQQTGKYMFLLVTVLALLLFSPTLFVITFHKSTYIIISMFSTSFVLSVFVVTLYAYVTYKFRDTPAIRARGTRYILYIYASIYTSLISNFIVSIITVIDHLYELSNTEFHSAIRTALAVNIPIVIISDAFFFGTVCGRLRVVHHLFARSVKYYTVKDMCRIFHMPILGLCFCGLLCSIFPIVHWSHFNPHGNHFFAYGGYLAISLAALLVLGYYTWQTRNVSTLFCDWYQNVRIVIIYLLFSSTLNIVVTATRTSRIEQAMVLQLGHQMAPMIFLMDTFSATFYHLWQHDFDALDRKLEAPSTNLPKADSASFEFGLSVSGHS